MKELTPAQYDSVRPLFAPLTHYLTPDSILAGRTPGRVFADDPDAPQTAVAWYGHRAFVGGRADAQARQQMADWWQNVVLYEKAQSGLEGLVLHVDAAWSKQITAVCTPPTLQVYPRRAYRLDARGGSWAVDQPADFALRLVDAALLADGRIQNMAYLTEEMVSERPSIGDFLAQSFGVCLLHKNEIVGWCLSEYNSGRRCEIGIATAEPFRRRGLATLMVRAFIDQALTQGVYDIGWICWAGNRPSVATAEKLGFDLVDERDVFVA
jgi:RimJ/RimL family protein N-acetyltransferase